MAQVEGVGERGPRGEGVDLPCGRELGQAQLLHPRRPLATDLDQPVLTVPGPRPARTPARVRGVQVGPVLGQQQVLDLRAPPLLQRQLRTRQHPGRVEVLDGDEREREGHVLTLLEHVFERNNV